MVFPVLVVLVRIVSLIGVWVLPTVVSVVASVLLLIAELLAVEVETLVVLAIERHPDLVIVEKLLLVLIEVIPEVWQVETQKQLLDVVVTMHRREDVAAIVLGMLLPLLMVVLAKTAFFASCSSILLCLH